MKLRLGNLSVADMEQRLGIEFPQELRDKLNATRQHLAGKIAHGEWHCFDIPFEVCFGDYESAKAFYEALKPKSHECKEQLSVSIAPQKEQETT